MSYRVISKSSAPQWAKDIFSKHLGPNWKISWLRSRKPNTFIGTCFREQREIKISVSNDDPSDNNKFVVLHEISHALRGKIATPSGRCNSIHHDEKFFRIAAKLYIDEGLSVLDSACKNEYRSGQWIMNQIRERPFEFEKDHLGFQLVRPDLIRPHRKAIEAEGKVGEKGGWWRTWDNFETGTITKINKVTYLVKIWTGEVWRVPIIQWIKTGN